MSTTYPSVEFANLAANASGQPVAAYVNDTARGRKMRYLIANYTIPATGGAVPISGDIINLGTLPKGAIVDPQKSHVWNELVHTALNFDIGDDGVTADAARYASNLDCKAANAQVAFSSGTIPAALKTPYQTLLKTTVSATLHGTVTLNAAASQVRFCIAYWVLG